MRQKRHNKSELKIFRKDLRTTLTPAEAFLWKYIKKRQFEGRKFRKQHSIDNYIVDFYCAEEKLIIELDGEVHMNTVSEEYDKKRDLYLHQLGYKVLRFENKMVFDNLAFVLEDIKIHFKNK